MPNGSADPAARERDAVQAPAGGWGSARATASILLQEHALLPAGKAILKQNKAEGFTCVSCSWAKPEHPHSIEACENGIKATAWELTSKRTTAAFFAAHTLSELRQWPDLELEDQGRLTEPLKWDAATDKYLPVSWDDAFRDIGQALRRLEPKSVVFYASGRASLEASFLYQLTARLYGNNNLPDSSNMCHESTSVALPQTIGVGIGTVDLHDFEQTDCIFALLEADDAARAAGQARILDAAFIESDTHGFEPFAAFVRASEWAALERESGLTRDALTEAASEYARANKVIGIYGMGLTQHRRGVECVQMLSNLLLLRGNIGKPGAGICPVRGHSNVQGQRTVGITEKPELAPLAQLEARYGFTAPRAKGLNTVEACKGVLAGSVRGFIGLGGNFIRAVPETALLEAAWPKLELTVQIATKLNRSHLVHGKMAYLLPCRGRIELDAQAGGLQSVTTEDSTGYMHASHGVAAPASPDLLSEPAIVAGIAKATLPSNPRIDWDRWVGSYALIREEIAAVFPDIFHDFNARREQPGGFRRPVAAAHRQWKTQNGKANFVVPAELIEDPDVAQQDGPEVLRLMTMRSDDQFNTTIYTLNDRFRGAVGTRRLLFANAGDLQRLGFADGDRVIAMTAVSDGVTREVADLQLRCYDIPPGCLAGYYPECNPLIPLWHHAQGSFVPAGKSIPVRLRKMPADAASAC